MLSSVLPYCNDRRFPSPWLVIFLVFALLVFILIEGGGGGSGPVYSTRNLERTSYQIR